MYDGETLVLGNLTLGLEFFMWEETGATGNSGVNLTFPLQEPL